MVNWYKNISIKYKFLIILTIFIVFASLSDVIAISGMKKMNYNTMKIYKDEVNEIEELHNMKESLLVVKNLITFTTFNSNTNNTYIKDEINKNIKNDDGILEKFEKQGIPDTIKPTYTEFKSYLYQVRDIRNDILDKVSNGEYESAKETYSEYSQTRDKMYDKLDELISLVHENALNNYNANIIIFNNVYREILIFDITVFIILILLGIIISNYFTHRLKQYVQFAKDIATGTINDYIPVDSNDEMGQLGKQLNITGNNVENYLGELTASELKLKEQLDSLLKMERKLWISEERYRLAVDGVNDGVWDIDFMASKIYMSDKCKDILNINIPENEQTFAEMSEIIEKNNYQHIKELRDIIKKYAESNREFINENIKFESNGNITYILFRGKVLHDSNGNISRFAGSVTDVTEQNIANDKVTYLAYYDTLTNLPNKMSLRKDITELFKGLSNFGLRTLVLIDFDNFKYINEVYGHELGDELIREIAERLKKIRGINDIIYYAGGASFALYSDKYEYKVEIERTAEEINKIINSPYIIKNNKINITASIGISYITRDKEGALTILKDAEIALNYCKMDKEKTFVFFTEEMEDDVKRKVSIYNDLITAVENEQFILYYQPKVNIINGGVEGMEALIRWNHPVKGIISPNEFIYIAEQTGIIVDIGYYVIREACKQIKTWHEKGYSMLKMAVNLSIKQLMQVDFIEKVDMILKNMDVMPEWLEFEITESLVMKNYDEAIFKINELKNLGITIALDDFGTGYSSLNYLSSLPIDSIKLDKTFVDKIIKEEKNKTIVQSFIKLAHSIELNIVAEGVETEEQLLLLKQFDCDVVQGYLFSKPLESEDFEQFIMKNAEIDNKLKVNC